MQAKKRKIFAGITKQTGITVETAVEEQSLTAEDQLLILMQAAPYPNSHARIGSIRGANLLRARRALVSLAWSSVPPIVFGHSPKMIFSLIALAFQSQGDRISHPPPFSPVAPLLIPYQVD